MALVFRTNIEYKEGNSGIDVSRHIYMEFLPNGTSDIMLSYLGTNLHARSVLGDGACRKVRVGMSGV